MTVGDLKRLLEECESDEDEVRLAHQPHWPFEYSIDLHSSSYFSVEEIEEYDDLYEELPRDPECKGILYLAEGSQIDYLPGIVKDGIGW